MNNLEPGGSAEVQEQTEWPEEGSEEQGPIGFNCLKVMRDRRKLKIRPAWMDDWDLNCKPPPGLEVLGPKTEAQMKDESKRKMEKEAADKEREAINRDFCSIYGQIQGIRQGAEGLGG